MDECREVAHCCKMAMTEEERAEAVKNLKKVTHTAKHKWATQFITLANMWEVATWLHSHK
jgi:hypothetical protein